MFSLPVLCLCHTHGVVRHPSNVFCVTCGAYSNLVFSNHIFKNLPQNCRTEFLDIENE